MSEQEFKDYWFGYNAAVLIDLLETQKTNIDWTKACLGTYYVKPNYPGRCSHICNAGFLVPASARGQGVGRVLAMSFLKIAPLLGYRRSQFNLVFKTNIASMRLWDALGFERIGVVKEAGRLRGYDYYVDAVIYGYDFTRQKIVDK